MIEHVCTYFGTALAEGIAATLKHAHAMRVRQCRDNEFQQNVPLQAVQLSLGEADNASQEKSVHKWKVASQHSEAPLRRSCALHRLPEA